MMIYMKLFILASFFAYSQAQHFICYPLTDYDTSHLTDVTQWKIQTDLGCLSHPAVKCTFYVSFCDLAPNCFNEYAACEQSELSTNVTVIGNHTIKPFHLYESGEPGFYAEFPRGPSQNVTNTTSCTPKLRINFICDADYQWQKPIDPKVTPNAPTPDFVDFDGSCHTNITIRYAGACNGYVPPKPDDNDGLSGGEIFLIILSVVTLSYFIFGALYNGLVKRKSGIYLLPNTEFWISLPLYMIEGCRASITCCTRTKPSSSSAYDSA